jgi:cytochrome c oxidase assembly factor CtaG
MTQHELLMVVAAPLLVVGRPLVAFLWAIPPSWRRRVRGWSRQPAVRAGWGALTNPGVAWLVHAAALIVWHVPRLYDATLTSASAHAAQHACFLGSALLFWWALMHARMRTRGIAVFCLFITSLHTGVLGILITLSRRLWYPEQVAAAAQFGLTPIEDQQLAGLVMGIPMGLIYTAAALAIAARWISGSSGPPQGVYYAVPAP